MPLSKDKRKVEAVELEVRELHALIDLASMWLIEVGGSPPVESAHSKLKAALTAAQGDRD